MTELGKKSSAYSFAVHIKKYVLQRFKSYPTVISAFYPQELNSTFQISQQVQSISF